MGIPDSSLLDLIEKVKSWISWGGIDLSCFSREEFEMPDTSSSKMCCECNVNFTDFCLRYYCQSCGVLLCRKCMQGYQSPITVASNEMKSSGGAEENIKSCKFCRNEGGARKYSGKIYPSLSPRESPEPPSPSSTDGRTGATLNSNTIRRDCFPVFVEAREYGYSSHSATCSSVTSFSDHPSPVAFRRSSSRSDDEETEDSANHFFSPSSEYCQDILDIDTSSVSGRHEFYSFKSVGSSPSDSPCRTNFTSNRVGHSVQHPQKGSPRSCNEGPLDHETKDVLRPDAGTQDPENTNDCSSNLSILHELYQEMPLDFENNGPIWFPPPPEDENDDTEDNFFEYDDDDDDIGESGVIFSSSSSIPSMFPAKDKHNEGNKEPLRAVVQGHFRALVSQLLQGEGINVGKDNSVDDWLDIVTTLAWQAATFVKPDTSKGGSMDPGDYVKVKCIATGTPSESTFIKGVVCTKNIKHKRMTSQYKNPRLLLLGGALEYQRVPNQLSSFNTLLQQEIDHLKMIVSKIEAHRPNVLLVEKSVSSYAQEYLLAKEISLVLNVKRPLLERIARCTGALITPSIDNISTSRLGHCELFRLERVSEDLETANQFNKKPSKTLMFFEGCPRRLGCTVLLKGICRQELKNIKHVVQFAVFAAYHLSLETSFLADEGASLPKMLKHSIAIPEQTATDSVISAITSFDASNTCQTVVDVPAQNEGSESWNQEVGEWEASSECLKPNCIFPQPSCLVDYGVVNQPSDADNEDLGYNLGLESHSLELNRIVNEATGFPFDTDNDNLTDLRDLAAQEERQSEEMHELAKPERIDENESSSEYLSATDSNQSILVSFSSRCVLKGILCERSRLLRIKFYGCFDKPLGRYLRDDLFDQTSYCRSCNEVAEAHVQCFTHQQGSLTINVKRLPNLKLPGERDGKIWMWHRCLRCAHVDGIPPATRRVIMSDAAWGLSFGKFLELSFSNHATANRVATCGHSLQRDCLRYYGFGSMVAFFRYTPIDILSVCLPPSVLEFSSHVQQEWIRKEAAQVCRKVETLYAEISDVLYTIEQRSTSSGHESSDTSELHDHIMELENLVNKERNDYNDFLQPAGIEPSHSGQLGLDILELNRLRRSLIIGSHVWDRRLYSLDSLLKTRSSNLKETRQLKDLRNELSIKDGKRDSGNENISESSTFQESLRSLLCSEQKKETNLQFLETHALEGSSSTCYSNKQKEIHQDGEITADMQFHESIPSPASNLSDQIDSAWTGTDQLPMSQVGIVKQTSQVDNPLFEKLKSPMRVYSFDSATRVQEKIRKGLPPSSLHLSSVRSFNVSGEYRNIVRDPVCNLLRTYSQISPREAQKLSFILSSAPSLISSASHMAEGARLLLPQTGHSNIVIAVYDNEPTSIISYALSSKEYEDWIADKPCENEGGSSAKGVGKEGSVISTISSWQSFGSLDLDNIHYGSFGSEDVSSSIGSLFTDPKKSSHLRISFVDESPTAGSKVKFSVTCYFAKQFDALRQKCCPSEVDFVRSLSRCRRWSAQGGKSNVYFAKSLDERFIIKQVTKTELDSFEEFAPEYFKYLTDSLSSGSPTCLAKILGIYQVTSKHLKGGRETKLELMVMENLFFKRKISRVYDLKGSARSRYNQDTAGENKVLLDMNLLETLRTKPIFLGSKAKRTLERAVWNDTSFLASVDVMDYSLLVGVDEESKELVLGIIDFMRQYTWDKHLETWVKASGILGGPKNASPTIISPKQYKRRFRKAMTTYFLTVPDQWSS